MDEIKKLSSLKDENINEAKKVLAFEITKIVHGEEKAIAAQEAASALFGQGGNLDDMPTTVVESLPIGIADLLVLTKIAPSKGQARTLIAQGGISINDEKITDTNYVVESIDDYVILKKGKKTFHKIELKK